MLLGFSYVPGFHCGPMSWSLRPWCARRIGEFGVSSDTVKERKVTRATSARAVQRRCNGDPRRLKEMSIDNARRTGKEKGESVVEKDLDIVLCHQMTDFDSLGCAVGLSKLRGPKTLVVCPGGEHPTVRRFLALHRQLFRIVHPKVIDPERLRFVGVVDTVKKERLGVAAEWPSMAEEVVVYDHHQGIECDITNRNSFQLVLDNVGALATLITERLVEARLEVTPAEATLLALAIHADTGSLTYEQTTPRDARMLTWLMEHGAIQRSISEFTQSCLTDSQQQLLSQGLSTMKRRLVNGCEIGYVILSSNAFLRGMATVAQDILDLSNVDVLLLCHISCRGRAQQRNGNDSMDDLKQVSIIGRACSRVRGVDFRKPFGSLGGGGHPRAASVSIKASENVAHSILEKLVESIGSQIPEAIPVKDIMQRNVHTVAVNDKLRTAKAEMRRWSVSGLPVLNEYNKVVGVIASHDVRLAERKGGNRGLDLPVTAFMRHKVFSALPDTPLHVAEHLMTDKAIGRLPVVNNNDEIVGIITRTDILVHKGLWGANHRSR